MQRKVFISTSSFGDFSKKPLELLNANGFEFELNPLKRKLTEEESIVLMKDAIGVIAGTEKYSSQVIDSLPALQAISRVGVGMDNIDFTVTEKHKIKVSNTKTDLSKAVAELALALIFDVARRVTEHHSDLASGTWAKRIGMLLSGKTMGVIGLGKIGKHLIKITSGIGLSYLAVDEHRDDVFAETYNVRYVTLEELLEESNVVSLHLNYSEAVRDLISWKELRLMRHDSIIVNTSRGELINENAVYESLKQGKILGAAFDVFEQEPYAGKLRELSNVVLTPHVGSFVKEVRIDMEMEAVLNFLELINS